MISSRASHGAGRPGDVPYGVVDEARSVDSHHEWLARNDNPMSHSRLTTYFLAGYE